MWYHTRSHTHTHAHTHSRTSFRAQPTAINRTCSKTGRSTWTPPSGSQYRIADDGFAYNKQEFVDHYGGLHEWNASRPVSTDFTGAQWDGQRAAV